MTDDMPQDRRAPVLSKSLRIVLLEAAIVLCFAVYVYRLFSMQVLLSDTYRTQSRTVSSQVSRIPAQRGEIFDRNATVPMVINTDSFAVEITPAEIPAGYYDTVASRLAQYLGVSKFDIDKRIPEKLRKSYTAITVRSNVSFETISNIAENKIDLPGVSWVSRPIRNYVETGSLSHIIGYVGDITQEEINVLYNQGYTRNSVVGKTGIERQYDQLLQGTSGIESRTVDVRGRILSDKPDIRPPQPGKNLVLTIDSRIQTLAEKTLGNRVGAVVVLKPATGEILALVSYPYFDPNIFNSDDYAQEFVKLRDSPEKPLLNRAVAAQYPPGSTFKIIMVSALLQEKSFSPFEKIECKGKLVYGNRTFHCHVHEPGHGWLDLKNALAQSCDVYFWTIGRDYLGIDKIAQYSTIFGLGKSAEIDLPNQVSGFIPTAQWKERKYHERWLGGDTMSASIGQGYILATPLQVADMMAMVCNEGVIYKPHLLKEVRNPVTNEVITEVKPEVLFKSDIPSDVWKTVQEDCRYTITDGTPQYPMRNRFVQSAGKTGTSEVAQYKNSWHSWMVAYAPYDAPVEDQVVVSTLVEAVNPWEWWSPYATNIIIQGIFANQTYEEAVNALGFHYLLANGNRQE
ncbi:penicillin-binding protein 2 [Treponema socranskii]|uniref:Penicillin-binding protein 2 n=2 Tax=Treponema socranskii TaxID=53419 RepID=U2KMP3_TRESO|nr:penicillin-binding protein 2 [Treponema socranskii]ERF60836.1 penicillin-binding protein 2 [Treponema socranskii subsp. socranskii VPI DR56BR1116 = ATCC 35536]ERJ99791.1 penicillin-binding protein 2 [Treponema socranskii subsp. socranskii VPI DR56BR1116 = ATCC 35536]MDR9859642.1 penicillin-binding protein 2 [Treponema socranskii]